MTIFEIILAIALLLVAGFFYEEYHNLKKKVEMWAPVWEKISLKVRALEDRVEKLEGRSKPS